MRSAIDKLKEAVGTLNEADLRFAFHLGDFVDEFPESFDAVMPIWEQLRMSKYHVLGNHDIAISRNPRARASRSSTIRSWTFARQRRSVSA